ncbi:MAG: hypothetical protein SFT90_05530 [Rickettsiales bacterium]|nr:hypothetical protein [Rickettsiales bacterium]
MESLEVKIARITEKLDNIEKFFQKLSYKTDKLESNFEQLDARSRTIIDINQEVIKISKYHNFLKSFIAGFGFAFSIIGYVIPYMIKKFFITPPS